MAEKINEKRVQRLLELAMKIRNGQADKAIIESFNDELEQVEPQEVMEIEFRQLNQGIESTEILTYLDKLIHLFHKGLSKRNWEEPEADTFLGILRAENDELKVRMQEIKDILKRKDILADRIILMDKVSALQEIEKHFLKKENILFPYLEKKQDRFQGLSVMWELHDVSMKSIQSVLSGLRDGDEQNLNSNIGKMFFNLIGMTQKEEWILFPSAMQLFKEEEFQEMLRQSLDYGFSFVEAPDISEKVVTKDTEESWKEWIYQTDTGSLKYEQLSMLLSNLPIDLTLVDENNKVRYFSKPKERFFPRSAAAIGRDVSQCHPPQSVGKVLEILESFRRGEKDKARFWIRIKGRLLLIQYFALRDSDGNYRGVLEASQDITEIQTLEGESRLVDWKN